jgi:hypothetical protein
MRIKREVIVFDAPDLHAESSFWAAVLGGTVMADDDWHSVFVDGEWRPLLGLTPRLSSAVQEAKCVTSIHTGRVELTHFVAQTNLQVTVPRGP